MSDIIYEPGSSQTTVVVTPLPSSDIIVDGLLQGIKGDQGDPATNYITSVNGKQGVVVLDKSDIGLDQVNNTSDYNKSVSYATQQALDTKEDDIVPGTQTQYYRGDKTFQELTQDAVADGVTNKSYTAGEQSKLAAITGTNTGNQTLSAADNTISISAGNTVTFPNGSGSPLTAKGDLYGYSSTNTRVPGGTNGQILSTDSTASTGLRWINNTGIDATSANKGVLALTGDLGGIATSPQVVNAHFTIAGFNMVAPNGNVYQVTIDNDGQLISNNTSYAPTGFLLLIGYV